MDDVVSAKCRFFANLGVYARTQTKPNLIIKNKINNDNEESLNFKKKIKIRKSLYFSIPLYIIAKRSFYYENEPITNDYSKNWLKKTKYVSIDYEKYCNQTDIDYDQSAFSNNKLKRHKKASVDDSKLIIVILNYSSILTRFL